MSLLQVQNLVVEFPGRHGTLRALDQLSFEIAPGEILGVVGESGAGKSLTGAAIIGLLEPPGRIASGQILLEGERIDNLPAAQMRRIRGRRIGAIFQDPLTSLNPLYSIGRQLIETITTHLPLTHAQARQRAIELLQETGIQAAQERIDHYPHQFSGGMRQRVVIALALAAEPKLIVADEPTTALDVSIQAQIINLLQDLQRELRLAYLFIAHDLSVVRHISDRVAVMYLGRIVEESEKHALYATPVHPYTQSLLSAVPVPDPTLRGVRRRIVLEGEIPNPASPPPGCTFHPRCFRASARCAAEAPEFLPYPGLPTRTACHHAGPLVPAPDAKHPQEVA